MEYRHEIVRLHTEKRMTEREIARELELAPSVVHYWLERHGQRTTSRTGRPPVTTKELDQTLYRESVDHPFRTAVDLRDELAPHCSVSTVRRRLKSQGLRCRIPARKPFLRSIHIQKRLQFAETHRAWSVDDWHRVVFTDEKVFRASSRGALRVYRHRTSDRFDPRYVVTSTNPTGRHTVCIWMAFGGDGRIRLLHRIEQRTLDARYYVERILPLLEDQLEDLIFMHDLSSIHTSRLATAWLNEHNIQVMEDWPPKGPDMNPVENVWAELVRRVRYDSTNQDQLWENVLHAFHQLPDDYFETLIESMPRRIHAVIAKNGHWTKY